LRSANYAIAGDFTHKCELSYPSSLIRTVAAASRRIICEHSISNYFAASLKTPKSMSNLKILALTAMLIAPLAAADTTAIKYINDWKWEGQAAPLLLTLDKGYFAEEALDVMLTQGTGSVDSIPQVAKGQYQIGSADINSLITWRAENPDVDLKAIYIIYNVAPFAILGRPSLNVTGPFDLEGRTLGAPAFDGAFAHWPEFVAVNGILEDRVTVQDVSFADRESMLAAGAVDAITGFSFSSYITLQQKGVPDDDISLMLMSDFGLDLYGNAIIVNPEFAEENPAAVSAFLRAVTRGYQETIAHPAAAVEHVINRAEDLDTEIELQRLVMAIGHHIVTDEVRNLGLGGIVDSRLEKSIAQISSIHGIDETQTASDIFDDSYLPAQATRQIESLVRTLPEEDGAADVQPDAIAPEIADTGDATK